MSKVVDYTLYGWPDFVHMKEEFKAYFRRMNEISVEVGCLIWGNRVIIPPTLQKHVLRELHEDHPGITRAKALARSFCWWPNMDLHIEEYIKSCKQCCENQSNPSSAPLHPWETAKHP